MNPLLLIFNPRQIDECIDAFNLLPIDKAWLTGYTEAELDDVIGDVIASSDYTHYLATSDDGIVPEFALEAVLDTLETEAHPVVTGYSNLDITNMHVNLTKAPFKNLRESTVDDYDMYHLSEIIGWPDELVPTCFAGFAITGMSREMWLRYPFRSDGVPTDYNLCRRLQADGVPIVAPKKAFTWHVKDKINEGGTGRKRLLVGQIPAEVRWDMAELAAA